MSSYNRRIIRNSNYRLAGGSGTVGSPARGEPLPVGGEDQAGFLGARRAKDDLVQPAAMVGESLRDEASQLLAGTLADTLLSQARAEADRILANAMQEAQLLRQQAEAEGRRRGYEMGHAEATVEVQEASRAGIERIHLVLESTQAERAQIMSRVEGDLVELALAIARKVIGDAVARDINVLVQLAQQGVEQLGQSGPFRIQLNPEDAQRLSAHWSRNTGPGWELVPDERVAPGGCVVTCGAAVVDARPETQMGLIQQAFRDL